jgi:hypothetical protein
MRQAMMVVTLLVTSGCVSRQQAQAGPTPSGSRVNADSVRIESALLRLKSMRTTVLDSLARELKASQRKGG